MKFLQSNSMIQSQMKRITIYTACLAFLAVGMTSCAKTTKKKVTNEWKIVSYEKSELGTYQNGNTTNLNVKMSESSFTRELLDKDNNGTATYHSYSQGDVNSHELTLKNDGTWNSVQDITYNFGNDATNKMVTKESGTWSFVGKTKGDEFKKNERILFNVLTRSERSLSKNGNTIVSEEITNTTFLTGESLLIYTIKESKKDEMQLEMESNIISEAGGGVNKDEDLLKITLRSK